MIIELTESDLQELFAPFSSATQEEILQIFSERSQHFYQAHDLNDEYELTEEKREYALDAWRAVLQFLHRKGYGLVKDGEAVDLINSSGVR
jgi:hypothetical protein